MEPEVEGAIGCVGAIAAMDKACGVDEDWESLAEAEREGERGRGQEGDGHGNWFREERRVHGESRHKSARNRLRNRAILYFNLHFSRR